MLPVLSALLTVGMMSVESYKSTLLDIQKQVQPLVQSQKCAVVGNCRRPKEGENKEKPSPLLTDQKPIIFISSSMPIISLKALAEEAKEKGGKLVVRGMVKGSLQETAKWADTIGYSLDIDPKLFETHSIQTVPTFLIFHEGGWHQVKGNVTLAFAIETVQKGKK